MNEHPQIEAFRQAAALMKAERYWRRNSEDDIAFLQALAEVATEVCYHLDSCHVLSSAGLAAYQSAVGARRVPGLDEANAELVLMTALDEAVRRRVAAASPSRNTGDRKGTPY
ncbi:hypothetical protein [Arthrobacter sp. 35W]|uniref:hypothetical protein n=1 Tax=Arthrobacter sp. 35W TaxID=1132441 RepID=UPI00047DEF8D|nr:hypothetical protein [Arthrobacter sp. 35W]